MAAAASEEESEVSQQLERATLAEPEGCGPAGGGGGCVVRSGPAAGFRGGPAGCQPQRSAAVISVSSWDVQARRWLCTQSLLPRLQRPPDHPRLLEGRVRGGACARWADLPTGIARVQTWLDVLGAQQHLRWQPQAAHLQPPSPHDDLYACVCLAQGLSVRCWLTTRAPPSG